ncbi:MAG: DUF368 domain-containing protein, partial [Phycisphaerae bacterium]|nr:DUF368 domain-containing protein [Phycisphaerae bacterium]
AAGFAAMAALAWVQQDRAGAGMAPRGGNLLMLAAGVVGAGAMILPGISGAYLWLVMGVYVPVLGAVDRFRQAASDGDWAAAWEPAIGVILPVGLGVLIGILAISNLLRILLDRFPKPTLGLLLGLLVGAVAGLWPFQQAVTPQPGQLLHGRELTAEAIRDLPPHEWPVQFFSPTAGQVFVSLGLIVVGFVLTALLAHLGNRKTNGDPQDAAKSEVA